MILYKENTVTKDKLFNYLNDIDSFFKPNLSKQVDLKILSEKFISKGCIIEAWDNDDLIAIALGYINDNKRKKAFLSIIYVKPSYRKNNIASVLLNKFIENTIAKQYKKISLKCNKDNIIAQNLYKNMGFEISTDFNELKYWMEKNIKV